VSGAKGMVGAKIDVEIKQNSAYGVVEI